MNLETLFGSIDYCECDDCLSVYSPAAYFVDILQYLRNNNLDPANPNTGQKGILGTPLEKLFRRRPDLGCLELTCPNTFTVLPYIDLVNEVMESFVVHLDKYYLDPNVPKQAKLEVFNVDDETTSELLAEPQHINYQAYCILKDAVYPFTLPYHQPIDAARIFLKQMGTSRYELLDTFRTVSEVVTAALTPAEQQELQTLHGMVLDRSADAEFLGITQEEHIILTREAFWPKAYFDLTLRQVHTTADYQQKIGVRPVHEYYGYRTAAEMLDLDETSRIGLTFVKKQFLSRTGIHYVDLVELLKTRFINPAFPQGEALTVLESIRFSYRFLQMLVDTGSTDPRRRFGGLIDFLNATQTVLPELDALLHPDPCHEHVQEHCLPKTDFQHWVHCYFERIGKLIVLESGEGPHLPIEGGLFQVGPPPVLVGTLRRDGVVVDARDVMIRHVIITGQVVGTDGKPFVTRFGGNALNIKNAAGETIGFVDAQGLRGQREERLNWLPARDMCDLDKVRLTHLDGSALTSGEYDRLQRFIRLWHKLEWTVPETDLALIGTSSTAAIAARTGVATGRGAPGTPGGPQGGPTAAGAGNGVGFGMFQPECSDIDDGSDEEGCGNQTPLPLGVSNGTVGLANVFGFASTLYFCIPDNPQLRALRDTIDDRLFKIRHCQDIDGVVRHLPLFEPPIDPALLVQAAAAGLSLSSVLNDLNSPMPNYRFNYLLQKALELCSEVRALGNAFLSAKEKGNAEELSQLRAKHESSIHNLVMEVKKQQLDEAGKAMDALQQTRKGPAYRLQHNLKLIGEDLGKVPDGKTDFTEVPDQIEHPIDESGLKVIQYEKEEMDKASAAADWQIGIGATETLASILHIIPYISADVKPIGIGAGVVLAGNMLGNAAQSVARGLQSYSTHLTYQSTSAGRKGGLLRQLQDRVQQANIAGYDIKSIDKQILTQQIRINITEQEITNQQKQIDNAQEVEEFLRNKYTNQDLYSWMDGQIKTLYHQAYNLAYDLAKRAEKVFRFERGLTTSNFIQYGYWDAAYDGLFAGERLYVGLKQLEAAYQEKRGHDFEVSKSISLRQVNPLALIDLKETGACEFALPEILFDMDYPGHYMRRVKSVSLRIPCIVGAHTSLNCTLRLLEHKFRTSAIAKGKADYPEQTDQTDERFSTVNVPISSIAVSSLEDENGVFELNFHDERYLPFEGAGAISKWRLELPDKFRQFDYDTITDVIMRVRYTSVDGGSKLKAPAIGAVQDYIKSVEDLSRDEGLFAIFDLKNDFPNEWHGANHPPAGATERVLVIEKLKDKLPIVTKAAKKIVATNMYLFISAALTAPVAVKQGGVDVAFKPGKSVGTMRSMVAEGADVAMGDLEVRIQDTTTPIGKMWLLERYVLA